MGRRRRRVGFAGKRRCAPHVKSAERTTLLPNVRRKGKSFYARTTSSAMDTSVSSTDCRRDSSARRHTFSCSTCA